MNQSLVSRRAWIHGSLAVAADLALAACGQATVSATTPPATLQPGSAAAATPVVAAPTSAATTAPTQGRSNTVAAIAPTATISLPSPTAASVAAPAVSPVITPANASNTRGIKLTFDAAGTQAGYQVQEKLAGRNLPSQAIGRTSAVTGTIAFDSSGAVVPAQSKIEVDLRTLKSDQSMRDRYIQNNPLQTSTYPTATIAIKRVSGLPWPFPTSGTAKFTIEGDLTVHGMTKPTNWTASATFAGDNVTGSATTPFKFSDFGMTAPRTSIALSVEDTGTLEVQIAATQTAV